MKKINDDKKILWLCNFPTVDISRVCGIKEYYNEGWNKSLCDELVSLGYSVVYVFFQNEKNQIFEGYINDYKYYGLYKKSRNNYKTNKYLMSLLKKILLFEKPNVIHIMGTEFVHSYEMVLVAKELNLVDRIVVSIQGLIGACAIHYDVGVPYKLICKKRLKDIIYKTSVYEQKKDFIRRGENEYKIISDCKTIIGRTEFDKAYVSLINPQISYFSIGEILRSCFYEGNKWNIEKVEKQTIFISQATYPLKGFHIFLEAALYIKNFYPDFKAYISGENIYEGPGWKKNAYEYYIRKFIKTNELSDNIVFLGKLSAEEMLNTYLRCNVFVSPSTIENSPNSIGEAMMLGVPVVSSNVGGINGMIKDNIDGLLYQVDAPYMLAYNVLKVFKDDELAVDLGKKGHARALRLYDKYETINKIILLYDKICNY